MHENDRRRVILSAVQDKPLVTVTDLCAMTGASEATIRRDINTCLLYTSDAADE